MQGRSKIFHAKRLCYIGLVIGNFFLTSCSKKSDSQANTTAATTTPANASGLKPLLSGFTTMGDISFHNSDGGVPSFSLADIAVRPGIFKGIVINVTWSQLEPVQGQLNTHFLDSCIQIIKTYNKSNPLTKISAKLRIWPGPTAPAWAKQVGGSLVSIISPIGQTGRTRSITIGRYWTTEYRVAWKSFLDRLGAIYDSEAVISVICNTSGSTMTDEPVLIAGDQSSIQALLAAGFTDAQEKAVLSEAANDYQAWPKTRVDYTFNPYRNIDTGKPVQDSIYSTLLAQQWRTTLGARGIIANHSLNGVQASQFTALYPALVKIGAPLTLQTVSPGQIDFNTAMNAGINYGATEIELWQSTAAGGSAVFTENLMLGWGQALTANATKAGL